MNTSELDPTQLSLADLRALRVELQQQDDVVSYVRRLVQARLDFVRAEQARRGGGEQVKSMGDDTLTNGLSLILGTHLTGGPARPPRPADDFSDHPMALELEALCDEVGSTDLTSMTDDELATYLGRLQEFEHVRSAERKELFTRIDALSAELVRRYRDGEADVAGLLDD